MYSCHHLDHFIAIFVLILKCKYVCIFRKIDFFFSLQRPSCHCQHLVAMVTMISLWKLHPRRLNKANWAECSLEVWFFSVHQHLMFFLFFAWVTDPLPPTLPLILAGAWLTGTSLPWRLRQWRSCLHSRAQTFEHTQTQTGNVIGFLEWTSCCTAWFHEKLPL